MQTPANYEATVDVNYGCKIHETFLHRDIRDVDAPDMVPMVYVQVPEKVWLHIYGLSQMTERLLPVHSLNAHLPHQTAYSSDADLELVLQKEVRHAYNALCRMFYMLLVNLLHYTQVLVTFALWLVVVGRAAESKDPALLPDADPALRGYQSSAGISIPNFPDTRFAKSSCISKSPILRRYRSFCFSRDASSALGVSNAAEEFSMNSFFHRLIITGDSSYFSASSLSVSRSLRASMATFALNLASYFFLV